MKRLTERQIRAMDIAIAFLIGYVVIMLAALFSEDCLNGCRYSSEESRYMPVDEWQAKYNHTKG